MRLRAINAGDDSRWTDAYPSGDTGIRPVAVKPDAPQNLEVDSVTSTSITITWDEPDDDGGHDLGVSGYVFKVAGTVVTEAGSAEEPGLDCDPDMGGRQTCSDDDGLREATIVGLSADTAYKIEVAADSNVVGDADTLQYAEISAARTQDATRVSGMAASIKGFSTSPSGKANITLEFTVGGTLPTGSSVVLFLEDDFQVPDSIPSGSVFFTSTENLGADGDAAAGEDDGTGSSGAPVFATRVAVDDDDYPSPLGDNAWSIRVYIPDMETRSSNEITETDTVNRFDQGDVVTLRITEAAGIKNDSEEGDYAVGYQILTPQEDIKDDIVIDLMVDDKKELEVRAKVALSDEDNKRDYELVIVGSGFNAGRTATAYVRSDVPVGTVPMCNDAFTVAWQVGWLWNRGHRPHGQHC